MNNPTTPLDPERVLEQAASDLRREIDDEARGQDAPTVAELAPSFPAYRIQGLIGQGGMGAVYRARHVHLDRDVALKVLPPRLAGDPAFEERFLREARALARLDHPHILRVHDFGKAGEWFYLVTEFVDGMNLRQMMQLGKSPPEEALRIVPQVCDALHFAHAQGVVHRDIKPENILIDPDGAVKIADFGLAKLLGELGDDALHLTETRQVLGTPHYIAPEQVESPTLVDHRADIFSLGVVFYEMLTGQLPIGRFGPPSEHSEASPQLDPIVMRSLEHEPRRRYQSIADLKSDVVQGASRAPTPAERGVELTQDRLRREGRRDERARLAARLAIGLLAAALLAILATLVSGELAGSWLAMPLLTAASAFGFHALAARGRAELRGVLLVGLVFSAWLPVLLVATALVAMLLDTLLVQLTGGVSDAVGASIWGGLFVADVVILAWYARHLSRLEAPRARRGGRPVRRSTAPPEYGVRTKSAR